MKYNFKEAFTFFYFKGCFLKSSKFQEFKFLLKILSNLRKFLAA